MNWLRLNSLGFFLRLAGSFSCHSRGWYPVILRVLHYQAHIAACLSWRLVLDCKQLLQDKYVVYGITTLHGTLCVDMTVWKWYHTIGAGLISAHKTCKVNSTVAIEISPQIEDNSDRFPFFFLVSKRIYSLCLRMCYGCIFIQCPVILFSVCQSYTYIWNLINKDLLADFWSCGFNNDSA